jgi:hypothetical protein
MNKLTPAENKIAAFDLMLQAVALEYEKATEEQRGSLSPFFKMFHALMQTEKPQQDSATACRNLLISNTVEESQVFNSHSSIID